MQRLQRLAKWAWPAALAIGVLLAAVMRFWPGPTDAPAEPGSRTGVAGATPDDLASSARRMRFLQGRMSRLREELSAAQADAATRRSRAAAIGEMLAGGAMTEAPAFLQDDTTVRALQRIIREANESPAAPGLQANRLSTAASVARERLRSRLDALREQYLREAAELDARAELLRQQMELLQADIRQVQEQVKQGLKRRAADR